MRHPDRFAWPEGIRAGISLTFDDGRASQLERAIPIVAAHDVKATFYPNVSVVEDAPDAWKALLAAGHEIGNHTLSHICSGNFGWGEPTLESLDLARWTSIPRARSGIGEPDILKNRKNVNGHYATQGQKNFALIMVSL